MAKTVRAVEITKPGAPFKLVERPIPAAGRGQVRIAVDAYGVCHSDAFVKEGHFPGVTYPRITGHEVVGRVDAVGEGVTAWKQGQRVGVGWHGGHCGVCEACRAGDFVVCKNELIKRLQLRRRLCRIHGRATGGARRRSRRARLDRRRAAALRRRDDLQFPAQQRRPRRGSRRRAGHRRPGTWASSTRASWASAPWPSRGERTSAPSPSSWAPTNTATPTRATRRRPCKSSAAPRCCSPPRPVPSSPASSSTDSPATERGRPGRDAGAHPDQPLPAHRRAPPHPGMAERHRQGLGGDAGLQRALGRGLAQRDLPAGEGAGGLSAHADQQGPLPRRPPGTLRSSIRRGGLQAMLLRCPLP